MFVKIFKFKIVKTARLKGRVFVLSSILRKHLFIHFSSLHVHPSQHTSKRSELCRVIAEPLNMLHVRLIFNCVHAKYSRYNLARVINRVIYSLSHLPASSLDRIHLKVLRTKSYRS